MLYRKVDGVINPLTWPPCSAIIMACPGWTGDDWDDNLLPWGCSPRQKNFLAGLGGSSGATHVTYYNDANLGLGITTDVWFASKAFLIVVMEPREYGSLVHIQYSFRAGIVARCSEELAGIKLRSF
ncbi:hypothetical protein EJ05DRAFT_159735 [Pseudovirgaria hyperparasitica]|uniref:Uncharacterized protein n=1 Tax=Pseudovirgaria hyperparasitica TaxID=470096 RepID=A0A6A6VW31_9PEZI|nr:uncharacterized protein EJ05DRAFT_159735 [Pseudovirgaria hyperparasitica]KAF2753914.1 hypothetical protein EJ05DRAFT_159735 [Pseudovirgaria hyperparasitica]